MNDIRSEWILDKKFVRVEKSIFGSFICRIWSWFLPCTKTVPNRVSSVSRSTELNGEYQLGFKNKHHQYYGIDVCSRKGSTGRWQRAVSRLTKGDLVNDILHLCPATFIFLLLLVLLPWWFFFVIFPCTYVNTYGHCWTFDWMKIIP